MVTVANCRDWSETQIVKSTLESRGITAFVPDEMSNLDGLIMHFGGFRVEVAEEDATAARAVLEEFQQKSSSGAEVGTVAERREDQQQERDAAVLHTGKRCVACDALIPEEARLCPKCGWTQPGAKSTGTKP